MWEVFRNNCLMDIAFEKRKHLNLFRNTFTGQIKCHDGDSPNYLLGGGGVENWLTEEE